MKVETRVFDLFDLFFEDRIVDRKLLTYFSIEPIFRSFQREKKKIWNVQFCNVIFSETKKGKKKKKEKRKAEMDAMIFTYHLRWCWLRCYLRS